MTRTSVTVRFGAKGMTEVDSSIRLSGNAHIQCCTYDDAPPILVIEDAPADISITTPDRKQVTEEDIKLAHRLADAVARYVAELERYAAGTGEAEQDAGEPSGVAA
jgi:hypothetical protein